MAKNLRLFIAINFSDKEKIVFQELTSPYLNLPVRWIAPRNIHLTVLFIGYFPQERLMEIIDSSKKIFKNHHPFRIRLNELKLGPPKGQPRLIWLEGDPGVNKELSALHEDLKLAVEQIPGTNLRYIRSGKEALTPHITLGRIKINQWHALQGKPEINRKINLVSTVNSAELMASRLSRQGADYTVLQSWSLKPVKSK